VQEGFSNMIHLGHNINNVVELDDPGERHLDSPQLCIQQCHSGR
jgi:hypothetical protein